MSLGVHDNGRRLVDSHGNLEDGDALRRINELRAAYRAEVRQSLTRLSPTGRERVQEYLDGEYDSFDDAALAAWLQGCENHEQGADA